MKKQYRLVDLDCANCARKMEDSIKKLDGVYNASVNFMTQKLTLEADDARYEDILHQVMNICRRIEPDCRIVL